MTGATTNLAVPKGWTARIRRALAPPTIVLLYHRVLPAFERDTNLLIARTDHFARHLDWLVDHCRVLDLPMFVRQFERRDRKTISLDGGKPRVLITFDDGYVDVYRYAMPLLRARGLSATIFVSSGVINTPGPFWWDALEQIVFDASSSIGDYAELHTQLKQHTPDERDALLRKWAVRAGVTPVADDDSRPMTWDELRAWQAAGMSVGGHTRRHPQLAAQSADAVKEDIAADRHELQSELQTRIETFAYPFGTGDDFDNRAETAAHDAGYRCAFANIPGNARWARNTYAIPRYLVRDWNVDEFAGRFSEWCNG